MKRFVFALMFCSSLLILLSLFLFPPAEAKENTLLVLLNLPAPAPPNPGVVPGEAKRSPAFYDRKNAPRDDAPIADILDYWRHQGAMKSKKPILPPGQVQRRVRRSGARCAGPI